jgi:hypothetical protein
MEALCSSKMSLTIHQSPWCNIPEDLAPTIFYYIPLVLDNLHETSITIKNMPFDKLWHIQFSVQKHNPVLQELKLHEY